MRIVLTLSALALVSGCGGEKGTGETGDSAELAVVDETKSNSEAEADTSIEIDLPFDLPLPPDSYVLNNEGGNGVVSYEFKGQPAQQFALGSKLPPAGVVAHYRAALEDAGFAITSENDLGSTASVEGARDNGDKFNITSASSGSGVEDGESQSGATALMGE